MPVPYIPLDVVDLVLSNLHILDIHNAGDVQGMIDADLAACSLVCRAWRSIATAHLFRVVRCSYGRFAAFANYPTLFDSELSEAYVEHPGVHGWSRYYEFPTFHHLVTFLDHHPNVCQHIRVLALAGFPSTSTYDDTSTNTLRVRCKLFARLIGMLPRLEGLHLHRVWLSDPALDLGTETSIAIPHSPLDLLTFSSYGDLRASEDPFYDIGRICRFFTNVDTLRIRVTGYCMAPDAAASANTPKPKPTDLKARHLDFIRGFLDQNLALAHIAQWPMVASLTSLTIRGGSLADNHVNLLLRNAHALCNLTYQLRSECEVYCEHVLLLKQYHALIPIGFSRKVVDSAGTAAEEPPERCDVSPSSGSAQLDMERRSCKHVQHTRTQRLDQQADACATYFDVARRRGQERPSAGNKCLEGAQRLRPTSAAHTWSAHQNVRRSTAAADSRRLPGDQCRC